MVIETNDLMGVFVSIICTYCHRHVLHSDTHSLRDYPSYSLSTVLLLLLILLRREREHEIIQ